MLQSYRQYWDSKGADVARMVGDRGFRQGGDVVRAGISVLSADDEGLLYPGSVVPGSVVTDTMYVRRDEMDDRLRLKTFGPSQALVGEDTADRVVDVALEWLERHYAVGTGEVGWALLAPSEDHDDWDRCLLVIGESEGMPAVVIEHGGFGRAEFRPRAGEDGGYLPLDEAYARLNRWIGWDMETVVVPRCDHEVDLEDQLYFAHVGEIHADFRHEPGGGIRVWPMGWKGVLHEPEIGAASEAAAAHLRRFGERWAADNPGRTPPKMAGRLFAADGGWSKSASTRSCYGIEMSAGTYVSADGRIGLWADPFRLAELRERASVLGLQAI